MSPKKVKATVEKKTESSSFSRKLPNGESFLIATKEIVNFIWDIGKTLVLVVAVAFVIRFYLVQPFYVEGDSMTPNFNNGEYLLIDELSYRFRQPERGEVIVFKPHISVYQNYIKRVIGLPDEKLNFDKGVIITSPQYPKGIRLEENYLPASNLAATLSDSQNTTVQNNEVFAMGDNRGASYDSRSLGPIAKKNIVGRVWLYIKIAPWIERQIGSFKLQIPKIVGIGRVEKPIYNIQD